MREVPGVRVLDASSDVDHRRAVITLAGTGGPLVEALLAGCRVAVSRIDMNRHVGVHPRIGAVDVVPFVPLAGSTAEEVECAARDFAARFNGETGVPVFFYGTLATSDKRRSLPYLRRGGYEGLAARMKSEPPDIGGTAPHESAGATAVGVRGPLIAFNMLLDGGDLETAKRIARALRESGGGLKGVQAIGVWLQSAGRAQISMNLTDPIATSPQRAVDRLRELAQAEGVGLAEAELVGLLPFSVIRTLVQERLLLPGLTPDMILDGSR